MKVPEFYRILQESPYLHFINSCKEKDYTVRVEKHHIYPRSFEDGKIDEPYNIILLSKADHLLAHILLFEAIESLGIRGKEYFHALGALHTAFKTRYEKLSEIERTELKCRIQNLESFYGRVQEQWQKAAQEARAKKWNGNCMGACFTEEANIKRQVTKLAKYGHGNGRLGDRDIIEKALASRRSRYNGDAMGQCRTEEALKKAENTMISRYGRKYMITDPEVRARNRQVLREKYGTCTGAMNNPESREKAKKSHQITINRKKFVVRTTEFKEWYKGKEVTYKNIPHAAVRDFLCSIGKNLEEYPEFV